MKQLFDSLRSQWVRATPEEIVRQTWIMRMTQELQFPKELVAVEKELSSLPDVEPSVPQRRIDILSYMKTNDGIKPLLLIECKESELKQEALSQVMSYNYYIKAPYVAIVNLHQILLAGPQGERSWLPAYSELIGGLNG